MSKVRASPSANVLPYKNHHAKPTSPLLSATPRRKGIYIASSIAVYAFTAYGFYLYTTLLAEPDHPLPFQDTDVADRYHTSAKHFDADVSSTENIWGITNLRRRLAEQAKGDVLEVSVGTGRNGVYYDLEKIKSLAFVDQSGAMVEIARKKWNSLHPGYERCSFHTQSAMDPLSASAMPKAGFSTIVQTMGSCSTPTPAATLAHLGNLADPNDGKLLLLEHGRSYYDWINWILDKAAAKHADKHGCWFNRDVGRILEESGLVIEKVERSHFGTLWFVEARPGVRGGGKLVARKEETKEERGEKGGQ